ncbi:ACP S-malonyltransferase [Chitinispirillales bacterium ANBcel5]|uniref:ACP S-malonyltransferase n=1 Tax=Cellulosispirillum alkaliphilum TaxID=3039283 RepID=UPI002A50D604|nr:ACP S-malonyltransferase [Chitinispirillales bacterium ANBcel5]
MSKTAVLFPGQGSQYLGMGRDLFKEDTLFRSLIEMASDLTGKNVEDICCNGPETALIRPTYLQPLIVSISLCYFNRLEQQGLGVDVFAGHSLGEISALAAADVITVEEAVTIAVKRGQLMDKVANDHSGGMMAVLMLSVEEVRALLKDIGDPERIVIANDNAPGQVVISGETEMLQKFCAYGRGRPVMIKVAGPWHSPFMKEACSEYREWVKPIEFFAPKTPLILNATATIENNPETIKQHHIAQLTNPVYWRDCMTTLSGLFTETIFEVGPGKIISGLARANGLRRGVSYFSIDSCKSIDMLMQQAAV